jgi:hypothetical protein
MNQSARDEKVTGFAIRLMGMFPNWTTGEAFTAAEGLVANSEQMAFQLAVEADLALLPVTA